MPELPEIETIRRGLRPLSGRGIASGAGRDEKVFEPPLSPENVGERVEERQIRGFKRWGKYLLLQLDEGGLLFSLRMTGKLYLRDNITEERRQYRKLSLTLEGTDHRLHFLSVRRLSRVYWVDQTEPRQHPRLRKLGPDPFKEEYSLERFLERADTRRGPIKSVLMNQQFLAGIGNIYASEICHRTGVDPRRPVPKLRRSELVELFETVPRVLREATLTGGSSFTNFRNARGRAGRFHRFHRVYDREGEPCVDCGQSIQTLVQAGRSTFYCPGCQE